MQTGLKLPHGADMTIYTGGPRTTGAEDAACGNPRLDDLDYGDRAAVDAAYQAITEMGVWKDIAWAFDPTWETEAVKAIAHIILCEKAASWNRQHGGEAVGWLSADELHAEQAELFSMLSSRGVTAMTARPRVLPDGIGYSPDTGNADADQLLCMEVTTDVIDALRAMGNEFSDVVQILDMHVQAWREAGPDRETARCLAEEGCAAKEASHFVDAAKLMERAAEIWWSADASGPSEASDLCLAAMDYGIAGEFRRAGQLFATAGKKREAAGQLAAAAWAYENAGSSWRKAGRHDLDRAFSVEAAMAWESAGQPQYAPVNWEAAGFPERSAQSWKQALTDAGDDIRVARRVRERGASLFRFDIEDETNACS